MPLPLLGADEREVGDARPRRMPALAPDLDRGLPGLLREGGPSDLPLVVVGILRPVAVLVGLHDLARLLPGEHDHQQAHPVLLDRVQAVGLAAHGGVRQLAAEEVLRRERNLPGGPLQGDEGVGEDHGGLTGDLHRHLLAGLRQGEGVQEVEQLQRLNLPELTLEALQQEVARALGVEVEEGEAGVVLRVPDRQHGAVGLAVGRLRQEQLIHQHVVRPLLAEPAVEIRCPSLLTVF